MEETRELTREDVAGLLVARIGEVLALAPASIGESARFEEDLAADSLDLIEVVEAIERDLRHRGFAVSLPDDELTSLRTVADAVDRLHAHVAGPGATA